MLVVIVNRNGLPHVYDCMKSLLNTHYRAFDVVLFDNGSMDGSDVGVRDICRQDGRVLLLRSRRAMPLTRAANLAIRTAGRHAKYVALLDSDVVVRPDWLRKLIGVIERSPSIGSCQSLLLRADAPDIVDGTGDFVDVFGHAISRDSGRKLAEINLPGIKRDILSARSAAMLVRNDLFERVGGLDESFGYGFEDVDLGWRIRLAGFNICLVVDSVVHHRVGGTARRLTKSYLIYQGTKNRLQMLLKNYEISSVMKYVPLRIGLDLIGATLLFLARRPENCLAVFRGLGWNLVNVRRVLTRRQLVQNRIRTVRDSVLIGTHIDRRLIIHPILAWKLLTLQDDRNHKERLVGKRGSMLRTQVFQPGEFSEPVCKRSQQAMS